MLLSRFIAVYLGLAAGCSTSLAGSRANGDFNGDGFDDLAIGAPNSASNGFPDAGSITVLYGSSAGLRSNGSQYWDQDSPGIKDSAEDNDRFGSSIAAGDFDGDGFADLALGVIGQTVNLMGEAGAVSVLYGSSSGLTAAGDQLWHLDVTGVLGDAETAGHFGESLAAGDFDADGYFDLAVGSPVATVGILGGAGAVSVLYGTPTGLSAAGNQLWTLDSPGVMDMAGMLDAFGSALVSGDFDGDGWHDLAIGAPGKNVGASTAGGAVSVLYGSASGLTASGDQTWSQDSPSIKNEAEDDDAFGSSLAAGDFDGDGFDDLAVGIPIEEINGLDGAGAVAILYGGPSGLTSRNKFFHQDQDGAPGSAITFAYFGLSLATGDFDHDGFDDLAIGTPLQTAGDNVLHAGNVIVLYGTANGLGFAGAQKWSKDSSGVLGAVHSDDVFGYAVAAGDFDGDGFDDLAAGAPNTDVPMDDSYTITKVSVRLVGFTHTNPDDVDVLLVGPTGTSIVLMSDVGGDTDVNNLTLFFTDDAAGPAPDALPLANFDYQPTDQDPGDSFPAPAPATISGSTLSVFNGTNPRGVWSLYVVDDTGAESGSMLYWALTIETIGTASGHSMTIPALGQASMYPSAIDLQKVVSAGSVHILRGSSTGVTAAGDQVWNRAKTGIGGQPQFDDEFGIVLSR